jgi:penicillin amidase
MKLTSREVLRRLGAGEKIDAVCLAAGMTRADFTALWKAEAAGRVPQTSGERGANVHAVVRIDRDRLGIPTILASRDDDLFFGLGYAMAQDRLFQLDFLRRKGAGRLSEVLGPDGSDLDYLWRFMGLRSTLEWDILARTVGLRRIAEHEWHTLPAETQAVLTAFSAGVNALIEDSRDRLPIEFDLLDYRPEPWSPIDSLTIEVEFRWYLTGRFHVLAIPELARRVLGEGPLYQAFLQGENDDASILPPGSYPRKRIGDGGNGGPSPLSPWGRGAGGEGSNNWVLAGSKANGRPLLASDPHIALEAVSCWYEVRLWGGSFHTAGIAYVGMPAVMFGRNERTAWGCTNNICSQRDLYQEKTDPQHPGCFLYDGQWEPGRTREEVIPVKGAAAVRHTVTLSRNGPIVDAVLWPVARPAGPVSLQWLGAHHGGWLTALLGVNRATSAAELRQALRPWHVPTFSVVYADVDGHIGYQMAGRIPVREVADRGFRPGWGPRHQWQGLIPFEEMPHWVGPPRGWVATANNRPAPDDFPWPLSGCWSSGMRGERIHQMIEAKEHLSFEDQKVMQQDVLSLRAKRCVGPLVEALKDLQAPRVAQCLAMLKRWDHRIEAGSVPAAVFNVFFARWTKAVVRERFSGDAVDLLTEGAAGLAAALLEEDRVGWFGPGRREAALAEAFVGALDWLTEKLGPDMQRWRWGRIHKMPLRHFLSGRGDLGELLDHGGVEVGGDGVTVASASPGAQFQARSGAGYRLIVDLGSAPPELWAVDGQSQSGHPGSPHYDDQLQDWLDGRYHRVTLDASAGRTIGHECLQLQPRAGS